jgi:archaemetzincin
MLRELSSSAVFDLVKAMLVAVVLLVPLGVLAKPPAHSNDKTRSDSSPAPLVVVRSLGPVDTSTLRLVCRALLREYPVRCAIRATREVFEYAPAWDGNRRQLDARVTLEQIFRARSRDALVELNITWLDIFESGKPYIFGLASLTDRVALISLARIRQPQDRLEARLTKLVLHEVGHTLGLPHHDDDGCVMRQDTTVASLDGAPLSLCAACHDALVRHSEQLSRSGQIALDRAVGHLTRGEPKAARHSFVQALWDGTLDDRLLTAFGVAFLRAGHYNDAISILDYAIQRGDGRPEARTSLGVALQMRGWPADLGMAIYHFERALDMRPNWHRLASHIANLRVEPTRAQGPEQKVGPQ